MAIDIKTRRNNFPHVKRAAQLRVRDYAHEELTSKEEDLRISTFLNQKNFNFNPSLNSGQIISSHQMREFLRDTRFFVNLSNMEIADLEKEVTNFINKSLNNIRHLQKDSDALDAATIEEEIKINRSVDYVHFNGFVRERDMHLNQDSLLWLEDLKTDLSFSKEDFMRIYTGAGAVLPTVSEIDIPISDITLIGEETDVGDTVEPIITTDPRFILLNDKVFRHVIIRKEFDNQNRKINRTNSYLTLLLSLDNIQLINWLRLTPAAASSMLIEDIAYINEANEEISLNAIKIDAGVEVNLLFEPVRAKFLKIKLVQYAPVQKIGRTERDIETSEINKILAGLSWYTQFTDKEEHIEGRVFDFSIKDIKLGFNTYNDTGVFRSKNIKIKNLAGISIRSRVESIPINSRANLSGVIRELQDVTPLTEFYLGIELKDHLNRKSLFDLIPLIDSFPIQSEFIPLIGNVGTLKFFPDLYWNIDSVRIINAETFGTATYQFTTDKAHNYIVGDEIELVGSSDNLLVTNYVITNIVGTHTFEVVNIAAWLAGITINVNDAPYIHVYKKDSLEQYNPPMKVYKNNQEIFLEQDYRINWGDDSFKNIIPSPQEWSLIRDSSRSGQFKIEILNPVYTDHYRVEYRPLNNQLLGKTKLVRLKNNRVILDKKLRRNNATINTVAVLRSNLNHSYITPIVRNYSLELHTY